MEISLKIPGQQYRDAKTTQANHDGLRQELEFSQRGGWWMAICRIGSTGHPAFHVFSWRTWPVSSFQVCRYSHRWTPLCP
jgi:hypothetical protein